MILKRKYKVRLIFLVTITSCMFSHAQDLHFSQFFTSKFILNPALVGQINEKVSFSNIYRNQWAAISKNSYKTISTSLEAPLKNDKFGIGLNFFHDVAGDSKLTTNNISTSISRKINISETNSLILGFQTSWTQRSIDLIESTWDSQFDGQTFNKNLPTGENIQAQNVNYFDISSGLNWSVKIKEIHKLNIGIAGFHLNRPKISFYDANVKLYSKFSFHGDFEINSKNNKFIYQPIFMFIKQGPSRESTLGFILKNNFGKKKDESTFKFGVLNRLKDATIIYLGLDFKKVYSFAISYDINTSNLKQVTSSRGGMEISLIYKLKKQKVKVEPTATDITSP